MKISDEDKINYGLKLRKYREKAALTQKEVVNKSEKFIEEACKEYAELEEKVCFNQVQLSNWEKGKYIPHHINRFLLSVIYGVTAEEIEINYLQDSETKLMNYLDDLMQEDTTYITQNNMLFNNEEEIKETIDDSYYVLEKEAFNNGTQINISRLTRLNSLKAWSIQKKLQYIIDLHMAAGLSVPKYLLDALKETDLEKKSQMFYEFYINFYNGALYARKKK